MRFRSYDSLRLFSVVAQHRSFTAAAEAVNLSKGAVSYQMKQLEAELGFPLFFRRVGGVSLTDKGRALLHAGDAAFQSLEDEITRLREEAGGAITLAVSTYFASRWLSARLTAFLVDNPSVSLRIQPLIDLVDLTGRPIDMAIRWGKGAWRDMTIEPLFRCPATPTGGRAAADRVREIGVAAAMRELRLLEDRSDSVAWRDWHRAAGLPYRPRRDALVIPDPNVRVQAVIDGQGVALNDALVAPELERGALVALSEVRLEDYGYFLAYRPGALAREALARLHGWLQSQARTAPIEPRPASASAYKSAENGA